MQCRLIASLVQRGVWSCLEAQSVFSQRLCSSQEFAQRAQKFFEPSFSISKGSHSNFHALHCTGTVFCPQHNTGLSLIPAMPHSCMPCILCMCSRHVILVSPVEEVRSNSSTPPPPSPPPFPLAMGLQSVVDSEASMS